MFSRLEIEKFANFLWFEHFRQFFMKVWFQLCPNCRIPSFLNTSYQTCLKNPECFRERLGDYWAKYFDLGLRTMTWTLKFVCVGG